jgi:hypothetical protein
VLRAPFGATWRLRRRVAIIIRSTPTVDTADHCADACDVKAEIEGELNAVQEDRIEGHRGAP